MEASLFNHCSAQGVVPVEQKLMQIFFKLKLSLSFFGRGFAIWFIGTKHNVCLMNNPAENEGLFKQLFYSVVRKILHTLDSATFCNLKLNLFHLIIKTTLLLLFVIKTLALSI